MRIALLGDIALYGKYSLSNPNVFDYFKEVAKFLESFDYVIGNFETPFIDKNCQPCLGKSAHISSLPDNIKLLKYLNISHVNLANNHMYDYGRRGLDITLKILKENKIEYFGVDGCQSYIQAGDSQVAISGFCCYSTNALGYQKKNIGKGVHVLNPTQVEKELRENMKKGYFSIASMHMGEEHVHYPNFDHILMARKITNYSIPYLLYGHHPHVVQGMEKYKMNYHFYSLGNFCFDDVYTEKSPDPLIRQSTDNNEGLILALEIQQANLKKIEPIPVVQKENSLVLFDNGVYSRFNEYCEGLSMEKEIYLTIRKKMLENYIASRKQQRNLVWYIKRFNWNSFKMLYNSQKNRMQYRKLFL